jgi:hypothetical protein
VKGGFMPTNPITVLVNGLPNDDGASVRAVIERDFERVFDALVEWQRYENDGESYDDSFDTPVFEAVRLPEYWWSHNEKRFESKTKRNAKFISKRKEVK